MTSPRAAAPVTAAAALDTLRAALPHLRSVRVLNHGPGGTVLLAKAQARRTEDSGQPFEPAADSDVEEAPVVVKCLPYRTSRRRSRVQHEADMLVAAQGRHVVRLDEVVDTGTSLLLLMEYLALPTLRDRLSEPWMAADLAAISLATAEVLARLHCRDMVFNDFKPRNIGVRPLALADGSDSPQRLQVRMFDFGHAGTIAATRAKRFVAGSVDYVAPEVYLAGCVGPASDVWSWGRTCHLLASGQFFERFHTFNQLLRYGRQPLPPVADVSRAPLPPALASLIDEALAPDQARRPANGAVLRDYLHETITAEWGTDLASHTRWWLP